MVFVAIIIIFIFQFLNKKGRPADKKDLELSKKT